MTLFVSTRDVFDVMYCTHSLGRNRLESEDPIAIFYVFSTLYMSRVPWHLETKFQREAQQTDGEKSSRREQGTAENEKGRQGRGRLGLVREVEGIENSSTLTLWLAKRGYFTPG